MKRFLPLIAIVAAALLALGSAGLVTVAVTTERQADETLTGSLRLYQARLDVAEASRAFGATRSEEALAALRRANATALHVARLTARIAKLLAPTAATATDALDAARRGARSATRSQRTTDLVAEALAAIAGYQRDAAKFSAISNRALRQLLAELRRTNREWPPT